MAFAALPSAWGVPVFTLCHYAACSGAFSLPFSPGSGLPPARTSLADKERHSSVCLIPIASSPSPVNTISHLVPCRRPQHVVVGIIRLLRRQDVRNKLCRSDDRRAGYILAALLPLRLVADAIPTTRAGITPNSPLNAGQYGGGQNSPTTVRGLPAPRERTTVPPRQRAQWRFLRALRLLHGTFSSWHVGGGNLISALV